MQVAQHAESQQLKRFRSGKRSLNPLRPQTIHGKEVYAEKEGVELLRKLDGTLMQLVESFCEMRLVQDLHEGI